MALSRLIGSRLRDQRQGRGLRQSDVAARAGMSASYLNLIEHNRRRVSAQGLVRLAEVLGCTPEDLSGPDETGLTQDLRDGALGTLAEIDRIAEFVLRFPGWAQAMAQMSGRVALAERTVAALNDRLDHDPYLSHTLHDILSALSAIRSTAAILVETPDIEPDWQARFHRNLHDDSERMARGAEALTAYLDGFAGGDATQVGTPHEELDRWLAAQGWHLAGLEDGALDAVLANAETLQSTAARSMARAVVLRAAADVAALPLARMQAAMGEFGADPLRIAARLDADTLAVFRRIATLPGSDIGLVICDGSGGLLFRKPAAGFAIPRFGASCPLWPLFTALRRPMTAVEEQVTVTGRAGQSRYLLRAYAQPVRPTHFGAPDMCDAAMLVHPVATAPQGARQPLAVGTTCRICVQIDCDARREASVLMGPPNAPALGF